MRTTRTSKAKCVWAAVLGLLLTAAWSAAQNATVPESERFELVSIHPVPTDAPPVFRTPDFNPVLLRGRYVDSRATLLFMIALAYDVKNPSSQLLGLPKWAQERAFAVSAQATSDYPILSPAENTSRVRTMLRHMLTERFQLRMHAETRQERVFALESMPGGIKLATVSPPRPPENEGRVGAAMSDQSGRIVGTKVTTAGLAQALSAILRRPVLDRTGSSAHFDLDLHWRAADVPDRPAVAGFGSDGVALLASTLRDECGLKLTNVRGSIDYWIVDHLRQPSEN